MDGILMSSRPKGWPRHAYQKRAGAIFFGFVAMFAAWFIETQFEWDGSTPTSVTVTSPPAGSVDPRRTGLYSTGSYWGGGGEQIDTLSGNLHFSVPLLTAQGRTGSTIPVGMVYDSQNWRQDNGANWALGNDVGYGFGWKLLIGSVTPYIPDFWGGADHYVFTDSTGAEYRLDQNNGWIFTSSSQPAYVWLDTTVSPNRLHFKDGSFWVLGSTSGGTEQDAGTMYPPIIEDRFGNQTIVTYDTGAGLPYSTLNSVNTPNTSSRILFIEDARGGNSLSGRSYYGNDPSAVYGFFYDHADYAIPHLTSFSNVVGTSEFSGAFTYTSVTQEPPFGTDANYGGTVQLLTTLPIGPLQPYQFAYDTAGAGELQSVTFPYGGEIGWSYNNFQYIGNRWLREVGGRSVMPSPGSTNPTWSYGISRPDAANSVTVHSAMTLTDASGIGAKTWRFNTSGAAWQIGLASQYMQLASVGGAILHDDYYSWSQDPAGRPYMSGVSSVSDELTGNQQIAWKMQTLDQYGNVTQSVVYAYNNTSTPLQVYNNTWVTSSNYTSSYIFNLLHDSKITPAGGTQTTLVTNTYDSTAAASGPFGGTVSGGWTSAPAPTTEFDASSPVPSAYKGALTTSVTSTKAIGTHYYPYGAVASVSATDGTTATASADASTNYAAPQSISVQNYSQTVSYNAFLGLTSQTGANGEQLSMTYDTYGRPSTGTSPYGAVTTYSYSTSAPYTQTQTGPGGVTTTTVDGFGRPVLVANGDTSGVHSYTATVYAPCACSPLGKVQQVSMPYAPGGTPVYTVYSYDGLGRTLSVRKPDGASTTYYSYSGNQTTVTDPAGKWKQFTKDVLGNLTTVVEPDPANQPGGTLTTSYTYNWMKQVTQVSMPRGSTTQTRTFAYDTGGRLTSATNPENGTVTYTYNSTNTLNTKVDGKGQAVYTYDSQNRVIEIQRNILVNGVGVFDPYGTVTYTYDTNPVNSSFSHYSQGRLTTAQYYGHSPYGYGDTYTEMYSYHPAGAVTAKNFGLSRSGGPNGNLEVDYGYDSAGRTASVTYPFFMTGYPTSAGLHTFSYGYDSMGRPVSLTDNQDDTGAGVPTAMVQGVLYDLAGRLAYLQQFQGVDSNNASAYAQETRSYNANGQLASQSWGICEIYCNNTYGAAIQYSYSTTQNNGQIAQAVDVSGETIVYQYDALKRLTSAAATPTNGSSPAAYTQTFQYDGFGNLTAKVLNGTSTPIPVDATNNRLTNASYDGNGNMISGAGATLGYDEANRLVSVMETSGGQESYGYDPANKRIYQLKSNLQQEFFTFYGAKGEKLGVFNFGGYGFGLVSSNAWFAGKLIWEGSGAVIQDRLGSKRASGGDYYSSYYSGDGATAYYPYGEEITATGEDREKFATYTRDSYSGPDYADQRFYASSYGRFNTPDPYQASGGPSDPGSWNRYSYVEGDPVNKYDPYGLQTVDAPDPPPSPPQDPGGGPPVGLGPQRPVRQVPVDPLPPAWQSQWDALDPDCQKGLRTAMPKTSIQNMVMAFNRAAGQMGVITAAANANGITPSLLAAIGIRETGFRNILQMGGGAGVGIFQIDLGQNPGVTQAQAMDPSFAANWAAAYLSKNSNALATAFPGLSSGALPAGYAGNYLDAFPAALADTYNLGLGGVKQFLNAGLDPDLGTTGENYGLNVVQLTHCF